MNYQYEYTHKTRGLFDDITNTPHKKFKHNEDSTFDHSKAKQKKSLFDKMNDR